MLEDLEPGALVAGQYVVERRVRRRPLANVYLARHGGREDGEFHVWQLKGVRVVDTETTRRFLAVMDRVRKLANPSIPAVRAVEVRPTGPLVVTERVPVPTLRERIAGGMRLQRPDVILLVRAVASVIDELHGCEPPVVHRALCPDEILVDDARGSPGDPRAEPDCGAWVEACGFVHALTAAGMMGQPSPSFVEVPYRSPDELSYTVEPRTDLFALASIVYECLTGERAFQGDDSTAVADAIRRGARPSVCALRPELSPEVDPILLRAWSTDFANGYATAWSFARDLTEALGSVPTARVNPRRQGRVAPVARPARPRMDLADAPDESSVVIPGASVRASVRATVPDEAELDRAFDALLGPETSLAPPKPANLSVPVPDLDDDGEDDDGKPTAVFSPRRVFHRPPGDGPPPAQRFAPMPSATHDARRAPPPDVRRQPTPAHGSAPSVAPPRPDARPSQRPPPPQPRDPDSGARLAMRPPMAPSMPAPAVAMGAQGDYGARPVVRAHTPASVAPPANALRAQTPAPMGPSVNPLRGPTHPPIGPPGGALRAQTPVPTGPSPVPASLRAPTPAHGVRLVEHSPVSPGGTVSGTPGAQRSRQATLPSMRVVDIAGVSSPPRSEVDIARHTSRSTPTPAGAPAGFPGGDRSPVKLLTTPPAPITAPHRPASQTRAAWILGVAIVAAATIFTAGQAYVARVERTNANPVLTLPRRPQTVVQPTPAQPTQPGSSPAVVPGTDATPAPDAPAAGSPDTADLAAVRARLESVVRLCLANAPPARTIRLTVRYLGASGHAADVRIAEPFTRVPAAECVDRAVRAIDLPAFGARDYTQDYTIDVE